MPITVERILPPEVVAHVLKGTGKRRVGFAVIHTEGDGVNNDTTAAQIDRWHRTPKKPGGGGGPGWRSIGYNFWIRMGGLVELGRPLPEVPAHAEGFNSQSIGIGLAGDGDLADFTPAQYVSLVSLCLLLNGAYAIPIEHFIGHREVPKFGGAWTSKTCPGRHVNLDALRARLAAAVMGPAPR